MATSAVKYEKLGEEEEEETNVNTSTSKESIKSKLNIALVGEVETGKSSFINTILGLKANEDGAAEVGFEKSNEAKPYRLNRQEPSSNITLWDYPGFSTVESNIRDYFTSFFLERFDGFLLFIGGNYTSTDKKLGEKLSSIKKPFLIVRTKIDNNMPHEEAKADEKTKALKKIRENVLKLFKSLNNGDATDSERRIFLISNKVDPQNWDLSLLRDAILTSFQQPASTTREGGPASTQREGGPASTQREENTFRLNDLGQKIESIQDELNQCRRYEELQETMIKKLEEWKCVQINLAIVGRSGVGKSTFINALRNVRPYDKNAAKTGPTQTTMEPTKYSFPGNPLVALWDIPGVGTPQFKDINTYCRDMALETFDEFVMIETGAFSDLTKQLATILEIMKKPFFFVRAKIDQDIANEKMTKKKFSEKKMLDEIRDHMAENLKDLDPERKKPIYLISSHHTGRWDFPSLLGAIRERLSESKRTTFIFSTGICSKKDLDDKVKELRGLYVPCVLHFDSSVDLLKIPKQ